MKNLCLFDHKDIVLPLTSISDDKCDTIKPLVLENRDLFFHNNNHLYHYENNELKSWYKSNFRICQIFPDELLNVFYLISDQHVRSISYEGQTQCYDIDLFDLHNFTEEEDEIVNAALSPDKEYIIILTKNGFVITILSNLKLISQHGLLCSSVKGEKESVNVGWGKAETQFQGSAKSKAQPVGTTYVDEGPPSIVWRADSQLFAVSYYNPELGARQIKVFKVYGGECSLQYTSKALLGLESHLSWRPHVMSHLATMQRLPNKYVLVFIEKNTELKDAVPVDSVSYIKCLQWNTDGTILALMREDYRVLLYTCGNCHWYLKQDLSFDQSVYLQWTSPTHCYILDDSILHSYTWTTRVDQEYGVVSVIDGNDVLVTDMNRSVIPPPMSLSRVRTPEPSDNINRVLPWPHKPDDFLVIVSSGFMYSYKSGHWEKIIPSVKGDKMEEISHQGEKWTNLDKACVWGDRYVVFVRREKELCMIDLQDENRISTLCIAAGSIVSVTPHTPHELVIQLASLDVFVYSRQVTRMSVVDPEHVIPEFTLPELCTQIVVTCGHSLARSPANKLYDNGRLVLVDVSSFAVHNDWLLVTTLTHRLVLFRLAPDTAVEETAGISRRLERGGTLVGVTRACAAVLQMPRGNLETVTPRPLVLDLISQLLSGAKYGEAFVQMRKHRIDLNLLVDYAPPDYNLLVAQVKNPAWLSNLIADLKPEDVTRQDAFYSEYYAKCAKGRNPVSCEASAKNVPTICSCLSMALQCLDPVKYAMTIMHCAVRGEVWNKAFDIARQSSEALDFLILLHDVNALYDRALKAYDLDLALQIAGKCQKDPKEYVPYLNNLRSLPTHRMKAEIDKQFGNYLSAVRHLSRNRPATEVTDMKLTDIEVTDVEECLELIRKHKLWSQTLDVFPKSSSSYQTVVKEYALQLELRGRGPEEAGLMYERAGAYEEALRCFVRAGAWRSALVIARQLKYGPDQLGSLRCDLSRSLTSRRDITNLVSLLEHTHCATSDGNIEVFSAEVVRSIIPENPWLAIELSRQYEMNGITDSDIQSSLIDLTAELTDEISNLEQNFHTQLSRLLLVRASPRASVMVGGGGDDEMSDWGSETGSTLSSRSGRTGTSTSSRGRRKRKQDRKLWSLREGNPREEISLVKTLAETMQTLENCSGRVKQLCLALVRLEMDALACSLQNKLKDNLVVLDTKRDVIWPPPQEEDISVDDKRVNIPPAATAVHHWELECLKRT